MAKQQTEHLAERVMARYTALKAQDKPQARLMSKRHGEHEADAFQFREADVAEFEATEAEIAKAEGDIKVARIEFGKQPRCCDPRAE
jgi:hypothetical protein